MFVCVCKNITTKDLEEAAEKNLYDPTKTLQSLGIGTDCGICFNEALSSVIKKSNLDKTKTEHSKKP